MFEQDNRKHDLPTYPSNVTGELRIILQVKDQFLLCFKHLESLQILWEQQNRIITKEFIIEQIKNGEFEIDRLEMDLQLHREIERQFEQHNEALISELKTRGEHIIADTSKRRVKSCRAALFRSCNKNMHEYLLGLRDSGFVTVLQSIADKIDMAQIELKDKLRPLLEYYKDIFYLQLHFTLALTQVSCYCMPLMTDTISLIDRLFFWAERPEFELVRKSGQICDRLRDIYTRLQRILTSLFESVKFLDDRIELQRVLEIKFYEKIRQIKEVKDDLLEDIHSIKLHLDLLEEENDRLVGTLVKLDPTFIDTDAFVYYAEHKNLYQELDLTNDMNNLTKFGNEPKFFNKRNTTGSESIESSYNLTEKSVNLNKHISKTKSNKNDNKSIDNINKKLQLMLLNMKKSKSKSVDNINEFDNINIISNNDNNIIKNNNRLPINNKCKIYEINDEKTDDIILTSDALPKDEN